MQAFGKLAALKTPAHGLTEYGMLRYNRLSGLAANGGGVLDNYLLPVDDGLPIRDYGSWTAEKLFYLERYLNAFSTSMHKKQFRALHYVDLFAGPGKCRAGKGGPIRLGSPLLALTAPYPFDSYFLVELDPENAEALRARCEASPHWDRVQIKQGNGNALVHDVVEQIAGVDRSFRWGIWSSLNLAFLDPEGPGDLPWATVEALGRMRLMDLIVHYSEGGLNRLMPKCVDSADENAVDRFFGGRQWRQIYKQPRGGVPLRRSLLDLYKDGLTKLGYKDVRSVDEPLIRNEQTRAPLYRLLFASKHERGNEFWQAVTRRDVYGQPHLLEQTCGYGTFVL